MTALGLGLSPVFGGGRGGGGNPILDLLAKGTGGFWHGGDLSRLFVETDGSVPATVAGDRIGRSDGRSPYMGLLFQGVTGAKPTLQFDGGKPVIRFDGSDDFLLSAVTAGTTGTWLTKMFNATGTPDRVSGGLRSGSGVGQMFFNLYEGQVGFAIGNASAASGRAGPDVRSGPAVATVAYSGGTRRIYVDTGSGAALTDQSSYTGNPAALAIAFGGCNTNGTVGLFDPFDLYQSVYVKGYAATPEEIAVASAYLMNS